MLRNVLRFVSRVAVAALVVIQCGCSGEKKVDITGRVTYNGSPLVKPGGEIVFVGPDGTKTLAEIDSDGAYHAIGVPIGPNRVAVYYMNPDVKNGGTTRPKNSGQSKTSHAAAPALLTPPKYAAVDTSNLSVDAEDGTVFNTDLSGPKLH